MSLTYGDKCINNGIQEKLQDSGNTTIGTFSYTEIVKLKDHRRVHD
jgi:hypothetical protein